MLVPAQLLDEQGPEIEGLQAVSEPSNAERHRLISFLRAGQAQGTEHKEKKIVVGGGWWKPTAGVSGASRKTSILPETSPEVSSVPMPSRSSKLQNVPLAPAGIYTFVHMRWAARNVATVRPSPRGPRRAPDSPEAADPRRYSHPLLQRWHPPRPRLFPKTGCPCRLYHSLPKRNRGFSLNFFNSFADLDGQRFSFPPVLVLIEDNTERDPDRRHSFCETW